MPGTDVIVPHHFLLQINLDHVPRVLGLPPLPETGTIFVFYEQRIAPFIPAIDEKSEPPLLNGEGVRVIYVDSDVSNCLPRNPPQMPDFSTLPPDFQAIAYQYPTTEYKKKYVKFVGYDTCPSSSTSNAFGHSFIPSECRKQLRNLKDQIRHDLKEFVPTFHEYHMPFDNLFGAWQGQLLPRIEELESRKRSPLGAVQSDHIVLFRFESSDIGKGSMNSFPECLWIDKQDLIDQNFNDIFVWEEN